MRIWINIVAPLITQRQMWLSEELEKAAGYLVQVNDLQLACHIGTMTIPWLLSGWLGSVELRRAICFERSQRPQVKARI